MSDQSASRVLRYLSACRRADGTGSGLWNILDEVYDLQGLPDLLEGHEHPITLDDQKAVPELHRQAQVHRGARRALLGFFFIVGRHPLPSQPRRKRICSPLFTLPLRVKKDASGFEDVSLEDIQINTVLLDALRAAEAPSPELETVCDAVPPLPWSQADVIGLSYRLNDLLPSVNWSPLRDYPCVPGERELIAASSRSGLRCVPGGLVCAVDSSAMERSVLHELAQLEAMDDLSPPLKILLGTNGQERREVRTKAVPLDLSSAQLRAVKAAAESDLSVLIGPPGTGKSFTLCAIALEHLLRGKSVLVACRSQGAVGVLADKLGTMIGESGFVIRGGTMHSDVGRSMRAFFDRCIAGQAPFARFRDPASAELEAKLDSLDDRLRKITVDWKLCQQESVRWAREEASEPAWWLSSLWRDYQMSSAERRLDQADEPWLLAAEHHQLLRQRHATLAGLMRSRIRERFELGHALREQRAVIKAVSQAVRAQSPGVQAERFAALNFEAAHRYFPLWMTDLNTAHRLLPLVPGLFDLVLIDEATHCDGASALPVIARGKRAVVTGDPAQLRHIPFIPQTEQVRAAERAGLSDDEADAFDYRRKSLLDLALQAIPTGREVQFLDEHFRSRPEIIRFANDRFYEGALRVMTWRPSEGSRSAVAVHRVHGVRGASGVNAAEVDALMGFLEARITEEAHLPESARSSIGLLSPFRAQVDALRIAAEARFPARVWTHHDIKIDTPHGFQGHERDVMLLSWAVCPGSPSASQRYLNRPDVFCVSTTRARSEQHSFVSASDTDLGITSLLAEFLAAQSEGPDELAAVPPAQDRFCDELSTALTGADLQVLPQVVRAGVLVDLLVFDGENALACDLIGYEGALSDAYPADRVAILERAGLRVFPISYAAWRRTPEACIEAIREALRHR